MQPLIEILREIFDFRFWTNAIRYFVVNDKPKRMVRFNEEFQGVLQKTVVLSLLLYSSNAVFHASKSEKTSFEALLPIIVIGFAIYVLSFFSFILFFNSVSKSKYYVNLSILHLTLASSIFLLFGVSHINYVIDDNVGKLLGLLRVLFCVKTYSDDVWGIVQSAADCVAVSAIVGLLMLLHSIRKNRLFQNFFRNALFLLFISLFVGVVLALFTIPKFPIIAPIAN